MDNLVIGLRDCGLCYEILQDVTVLNLGNAKHSVPYAVVVLHFRYDAGHIVKLLGILLLGPVVCTVRQIFIVVLAFVVIGVKQVFQIIETYHVAALPLCLYGK